MNENEWNVSNLVWNSMNLFYNNITIRPLLFFKKSNWIYWDILGVLVKNSSNLIPFPLIPPNFGENEKFEILREQREMSVPSYPIHSFPLKLLNMGMNFSFLPLKLSNKGREEYSTIILYIPFHSITFPLLKQGLKFKECQGIFSLNFLYTFLYHV